MNDEDFIRFFGALYDEVMSRRNDDDYMVNQPQLDKLIEIVEFFISVAREGNGKIEPVELKPREQHGGVTAHFIVFDVYGEDIQKFCKIMSYTSALTIDSTTEGVCISVTVPNIYIPVKK